MPNQQNETSLTVNDLAFYNEYDERNKNHPNATYLPPDVPLIHSIPLIMEHLQLKEKINYANQSKARK